MKNFVIYLVRLFSLSAGLATLAFTSHAQVLEIISLRVTRDRVSEASGQGATEFIVERTGVDINHPYTVAMLEGLGTTATRGTDYQPTPRFITIPAGATQVRVSLDVVNDDCVEPDETVMMVLFDDNPFTNFGQRIATVTIESDDKPEALSATYIAEACAPIEITLGALNPCNQALNFIIADPPKKGGWTTTTANGEKGIYTPNSDSEGGDSFAFVVEINGILSEESVITIQGNRAPAASIVPDQEAIYGRLYDYALPRFEDPDGWQTLTYTVTGLPPEAGIRFDPFSLRLTGIPTESGTYPVTLTAVDNGCPPLSNSVSFVLTVKKAGVLIVALPASKEYGEPNPPWQYVVSLLDDASFPSFPDPPDVETTATITSPVGKYMIYFANAPQLENYEIHYGNDFLDVTKAPLDIVANSKSRRVGEANPPFTLSYIGFKNGDSTANLTSLPIASTSAGSASSPGMYPITLSGGSSLNYTIGLVPGILHVYGADEEIPSDIGGEGTDPGGGSTKGGAAAWNDAAITPEDTPLILNVLLNDHDTECQQIQVNSFTQAAHGTVTTNPDGTLTYSPAPNFYGTDSFTYTVSGAGPEGTPPGPMAAMKFDGVDDQLDTGSWSPGAQWTVAAWVNAADLPDGRRTIVGGAADFRDWGITLQDGQFGALIRPAGGPGASATILASEPISPGIWYYVAGTCDGATARLYVDGQLKASGAVDPGYIATGASTRIGGEVCCTDNRFPGFIREVRIWNRPLADMEIRQQLACPLASTEPGPVGYWPLDAVNEFNDLSGSGRDATQLGAPEWIQLSRSETATVQVMVLPINDPPLLAPIADQSAIYGTPFTITFAAAEVDGGQSFSYSASGTPFNMTVNGNGPSHSLSGTPTEVGSFTITITATDNGSPALSASTSFKLNVQKAPLTITADNQWRAYGGVFVPPLTVSYSGFINGDTAANLTTQPVVTTSVTQSSPIGEYPITVSGASSSNYDISYVSGTFTVFWLGDLSGPIINPANNHRYYLLDIADWYAAEAAAQLRGGHLVTIRNQAENDFVYNTFSQYGGVPRWLATGLHDTDQANNSADLIVRRSEFSWISGEPVTYTYWNEGEPSNSNNSEYFGQIFAPDAVPGGYWNDGGLWAYGVVEVLPPSVVAGPIVNPENGHEYYLFDKGDWVQSETVARELGGHLATIRNQAEQDFVFSTFCNYGGVSRHLWIGLYDSDPAHNASDPALRQDEFVWSSGEPVTYSRWNVGEPNNFQGGGEFYTMMFSPSAQEGGGLWNDNLDDSWSFFNYSPFNGVLEVIPTNRSPIPGDDSFSTRANHSLTISFLSLLANDSDPNGDGLAIAGVSLASTHGGTLAINAAAGTITYTPAANFSGEDTFGYVVADSRAAEASGVVHVNVRANTPPIANPDTAATGLNKAISLNANKLTVNDGDADGDHLSVTAISSLSVKNGSVTLVQNKLTYTPPNNFEGSDSFTYRVEDGEGGVSTGTVTVSVAPPLSISPILVTTQHNGSALVKFLGKPKGRYIVQASQNGLTWTNMASVTAASNGAFSVIDGNARNFPGETYRAYIP